MSDMLEVERRDNGVAIVTIRREPVNTLSLGLWRALAAALEELEADPAVRGVIFQSGLQRDVFTAGNDILELYAPRTTKERYSEFWVTQNRFLASLYTSRLATVAAIRGACPAGGCCLALCCDYRVMTDFGSIGLNEVALGITVPKYWCALMARTIGQGPAEKLVQGAVMLPPAAALARSLVDEVVTRQQLLPAAEAAAARLAALPEVGRAETKKLLRADFAQEWVAYATPEAEGAWALLSSPPVVATLGAVLQRLSSGGKKKAGQQGAQQQQARGPASKL